MPAKMAIRISRYFALFVALAFAACSCYSHISKGRSKLVLWEPRHAVLDHLRDEINASYGFRDGVPRINLGPCGRFARDFREQWNARFPDKVHIAFVMSDDGATCHHVLLKLPDGNYYDGGNGVMPAKKLSELYANSHVDEMIDFDAKLLDKRSYGLGRSYPVCSNYSDTLTNKLIRNNLERLAKL